MTPFDRSYTSHSHSIVTLVLVCIVSEIKCDIAAYLQLQLYTTLAKPSRGLPKKCEAVICMA